MKLNKQYPLVLVVVFSMFICSLLVFYLQNLSSVKNVLAGQNQQDFTLILQKEGIIEDLSSEYSFTYEPLTYKVIYGENNIFRVMKNTRSIDIPMYSEGVAPNKMSEIAIDQNFSKQNGLTVGDSVDIGNTSYFISGVFTLPDAVTPVVADNGITYKSTNQAFILCSEDLYSTWDEQERISYSGRFSEHLSEKQKQIFLEKMLMNTSVKSIVNKEDNPQILSSLIAKEKMFKVCLISALCFLILTIVILLTTSIIQNINETKSDMGVFKALGYTTVQIAKKYLVVGVFVLIGGIIGYLTSYIISPLFINRINSTFLVPNVLQKFDPVQFILFTIIPALFFSILAFGIAVFTLRKPPLEMIHNAESVKLNIFVKRRQKIEKLYLLKK